MVLKKVMNCLNHVAYGTLGMEQFSKSDFKILC